MWRFAQFNLFVSFSKSRKTRAKKREETHSALVREAKEKEEETHSALVRKAREKKKEETLSTCVREAREK